MFVGAPIEAFVYLVAGHTNNNKRMYTAPNTHGEHYWRRHIKPTEKKMVFSVEIGNPPYGAVTAPARDDYARRCGATHVTHRVASGKPVIWEKFAVRTFLELGYRVLCLDADILVRPECPDLFATLPKGFFYGVHDPADSASTSTRVEACAKALGMTVKEHVYVNAGFWLCEPEHSGMFELDNALFEKASRFEFPEQDLISTYLSCLNIRSHVLPVQFNCDRPRPTDYPLMIHPMTGASDNKLELLLPWL